MAEHLARIIGTEEDRVNCPFYWKIGACRHGDQCSRAHYKPTSSQTLILRHMYQNPPIALAIAEGQTVPDEVADQAQDHFEQFYEEVFEELAKYGEVEEVIVCDNIGDHMIGNVYVKYVNEDNAEQAAVKLTGRYYAGRLIQVEFSPVTDFREARCRQFVDGQCTRGGYCNFMHMKHVPRSLKRRLFKKMYDEHPEYRDQKRDRSRSLDRYVDRRRSHEREEKPRRDYRRDDRFREQRRRGEEERPRDDRQGDRHRTDGRSNSEERRAMIATWNEELENGGENFRGPSEERRAIIARWNKEVDETEPPPQQ
eukprot:Polyplicarium_translucidae@DN3176_c0_g1_i2.p1